MAIVKVITIKGETKDAQKGFKDLGAVIQEQKDITIEFEKELIRLQRQLDNTSKGSLQRRKALKNSIVDLKGALTDQRISLKDLNNQQKKGSVTTKDFAEQLGGQRSVLTNLSAVTGGYANQLFSVFDLFKSGVKSIKAFAVAQRAAFIGTGIGALIIAVTLLITYWDDILKAITRIDLKLKNQLSLVQSIGSVLEGQLSTVNKQLELNKLQGKANEELEKQKIAILERLREQNEAEVKILENQLDRLKATSTEVGFWETIKNNVAFTLFGTKALASEAANLAAIRLKEIKDLEASINKQKAKEIDLEIQLFNIKNPKADSKGGKTNKEQTLLEELEAESLIGLESTQRAFERERLRLQGILDIQKEFQELTNIQKLELDEELALSELDALFATEEEKASIRAFFAEKIANEEKKISDDAAKSKEGDEENLFNAKIQIAQRTIFIVGALAKEGSDLAKGIAASQATINTFQGVTAALSAVSVIPEPFGSILKFANAAAVGIAGAINVKKILATKPITTSAGGDRGAGGAPPPAPSFNLVSGTEGSQLNDSINLQNQQPIEAVVVSGNVTSAQSVDRNIVDGSGL